MKKIDVIVAALIVIVFGLLIANAGVFPAASAGDEIWYAESAYGFINSGVFRRAMHDDLFGGAVHDFMPPTPAIFDVIAFKTLGLNQFSLGLPPIIALAVTLVVTSVIVRLLSKCEWRICFLAAISLIFFPKLFAELLRNRFEAFVLLFVSMSVLLAIFRYQRSESATVGYILSGTLTCFAGASHYPVAVFIPLIIILITVVNHSFNIRFLYLFLAGIAIGTICFGIIIGFDISGFVAQNTGYGRGYAFGVHYDNISIIEKIQLVVALTIGGILAYLGTGWRRVSALYAVILIVLSLVYFPGLFVYGWFLIIIIYMSKTNIFKTPSKKYESALIIAMGTLSVISLAVVVALSFYERKDRNYSLFSDNLDRVLGGKIDGTVLFDQPAWLYLRTRQQKAKIHHLLKPDQTLQMASKILFDASEWQKISAVIVSPGQIEVDKKTYPLLDAFLSNNCVGQKSKFEFVSATGVARSLTGSPPYQVLVVQKGVCQ